MKTLILLAALSSATAFANPFDSKCEKSPYEENMQTAVIKDIRARVAAESPGRRAFTFKFTSTFDNPHDHSFNVSAYYETLGEEADRRGHIAQYSLNRETCAPEFKKAQALVGGTDASAERLGGRNDHETCNFGDGQDTYIKATVRDAKWLAGQNTPGASLVNFSFTGVTRVGGTADVTAIYEAARPGLFSSKMLWQVNVDAKTCEPMMRVSTPLRDAIVNY